MHPSVYDFADRVINLDSVIGKDVLEVGSLDENGSIRPLIEKMGPATYTATDMRPGKGVDRVCEAASLPPLSADYVISMEMLEHAENWRAAMLGMTLATRFGGLLLITTRSTGFHYHGFPGDYNRFPVGTMYKILVACGFDVITCESDPDPNSPGVCALGSRVRKPDLEALVSIEAEPAPKPR